MQAPAFWFNPPGLLANLLRPFAWLYDRVGRWIRARVNPCIMPVPVLCVGNCVLGGAGKTPLVADLAQRLTALGQRPHIISRGYGGALPGPLLVDPAHHNAADVGDEPLMLSKHAPVWVAKNKVAGAEAAIEAGATFLLLDDGMQNPSLFKNAVWMVVDTVKGFGNGLVFPAGPLRETPAAALKKADVVVIMGNPDTGSLQNLLPPHDKPVLRVQAETICADHSLRQKNVFAFCGIAHPEKFYAGIEKLGAMIQQRRSFPDHHLWSRSEILALLHEAEALQLILVTTAKDAARIPHDLQHRLVVCDVQLQWQEEAALITFLEHSSHVAGG